MCCDRISLIIRAPTLEELDLPTRKQRLNSMTMQQKRDHVDVIIEKLVDAFKFLKLDPETKQNN